MLILAIVHEPSLGIFAPPVPHVFVLFLGLLLAIDYSRPKVTERFRTWLIIGVVPVVAVFLVFESKAYLRIYDFFDVYKIRTNPGFSDYLANYIILTFTSLILTRALRSKQGGVIVVALLELTVFLLALALEAIHFLGAR